MTSVRHWREALADTLGAVCGDAESVDAAPYVLDSLSARRLLALDESLRRARWTATLPGPVWPVFAPVPDEELDAQLFCVGCHADGHLRERALRLSQTREGRLPGALAAIRCDDWVEPVRACAEDALRTRIERDPSWIFGQLPLLIALSERQRFREGAWRSLLKPALLAQEHATRRWCLLGDPHPRVRMLACRLIVEADSDRAAELAAWALDRHDPVAALWAIRDLPALSGLEFEDALLALAWRSRFAPVRAQALRLLARRPDAEYVVRVREALRDPNASVRGVAAFAARAQGIDPRAVWRAAIAEAPSARPLGAVLALAERPDAEDIALLRPWLSDVSGHVRCAVLRGLINAGVDDVAALLREALAAPQAKVVRLALALGKHQPGFLTRDALIEAHASAANACTRQILLDASGVFGAWAWLDTLLELRLRWPDDADVTAAFARWSSHSGHRHTPLRGDQREALLAKVDEIAPRFPDQDWPGMRRAIETGWVLPTRFA